MPGWFWLQPRAFFCGGRSHQDSSPRRGGPSYEQSAGLSPGFLSQTSSGGFVLRREMQGMRNGMTRETVQLLVSFQETWAPGSFPHSLLSTSKWCSCIFLEGYCENQLPRLPRKVPPFSHVHRRSGVTRDEAPVTIMVTTSLNRLLPFPV